MVKNHLKRIAMPTTWTTAQKKGVAWVAKTKPGAHSLEDGMPLVLVIRELLKYANTAREVKNILNDKKILIDSTRRKDHRYNVGFMDVISIPDLNENYRISLNENGKLKLIKINEKEAKSKICQIKNKGLYQGKTQLTLSDGRNILVDKGSYKTSDSIVISLPDQKITEHIKFEKGASVILIDGKRIGVVGKVEDVKNHTVTIKSKDEKFETLKKYCFVVGKEKPVLTIE